MKFNYFCYKKYIFVIYFKFNTFRFLIFRKYIDIKRKNIENFI